jgi:hypothetical protein
MKKLIIFTAVLIYTTFTATSQTLPRYVGTWLASEGNMSYKITFTLDTIIQDGITGTYLFGDIMYLKNGKVIRHVKKDRNRPQLYIYIESSDKPAKDHKLSRVFATYNDLDRNSESFIDLTISDDNNSFQWEYNEMVSHEELSTKLWKRSHGLQENQPMDLPKKLTFKRVSE